MALKNYFNIGNYMIFNHKFIAIFGQDYREVHLIRKKINYLRLE